MAHLTAVIRLDPGREAAWKRLGCKKVGGRWVTEAQLRRREGGGRGPEAGRPALEAAPDEMARLARR